MNPDKLTKLQNQVRIGGKVILCLENFYIQYQYFCLTYRSPLRKPLSKTMKLRKFTVTDLRQLTTSSC